MKLIATGNSVKKYHGRSTEQISQLGRNSENGILMARDLYKETKAEVFWPFEKKWGLGKDRLEGKDRWEKRKKRTQEAVMGDFDMSLTEVAWLAIDGNCSRCAVKDVTSYELYLTENKAWAFYGHFLTTKEFIRLKKDGPIFSIKLQSVSILAIDESHSHTHVFKARSRIILSRSEPLFHWGLLSFQYV